MVDSFSKNTITRELETIIHKGVKGMARKLFDEADTPLDIIIKPQNIYHKSMKYINPSLDIVSFKELDIKKSRRGRILIESIQSLRRDIEHG